MTCSGCARAGGGWSGRAPRRQRRARGPARRDPLGSERRGWPGAGLAGAAGELGLGREHAASRRQRAPGAAVRCAVAARAGAERRGGERERRRPLPRIPGRAGGRARGGITQVTFIGHQFAEPTAASAFKVGEKEVLRLDLKSVAPPSKLSVDVASQPLLEICGSSKGSPRRRHPRTRRSGSRPCRRPGSRSPQWCCPHWPWSRS